MPRKPCIIITRPLEDSSDTAKLLTKHGLGFFIEPVISIQQITNSIAELENTISRYDGIIITSKNAIRAINTTYINRNSKIISLGKSTNSFAKKLGFKNIEYAGENISQLRQYINSKYTGKIFTYASGELISEELNSENCGNNITRIILYKTIPVKKFTNKFTEKLQHDNFDGIMFFSVKTAKIFYNMLQNEGLETYTKNLYAFCLSNNIEESVKNYGFKATISSKNPNMNAIIKIIEQFQF